MGSRASTLLRDEEIEEIKKETGCEYGAVGSGCPPPRGVWAGCAGLLARLVERGREGRGAAGWVGWEVPVEAAEGCGPGAFALSL